MKFILPTVWIGSFAAVTLSLFFAPYAWHGRGCAPVEPSLKWIFLGMTLLGPLIWWWPMRLKRVRMNATTLYISNYSTEIAVPLREVAEVTATRWANNPVTIRFRVENAFGSAIVFMPKIRFASWSSHPVVGQIREAVARSSGRLHLGE